MAQLTLGDFKKQQSELNNVTAKKQLTLGDIQSNSNAPIKTSTNLLEELTKKQKELSSKMATYKGSRAENLLGWLIGTRDKKLEKDKTYKNMQKEYLNLEKDIQNLKITEKQTSGEKFVNTVSGNFMTGLKGIESAVNKANPFTNFKTIGSDKLTYEERKAQEALNQTNNKFAKTGLSLLGSYSRMIPQVALGGSIFSTGSTVAGFANYGGGAYNEAKREGKTEAEATKYGLAIGSLEMGLQKALGGLSSVYGKSWLGKITENLIKSLKNNPGIIYLADIGRESVEEYLQDVLNPVVRNLTMGEKNKFKPFTKQALESGILGALTAGLLEGPSTIKNSANKNINNTPTTQQNTQVNTNVPIQQEQVSNTPQIVPSQVPQSTQNNQRGLVDLTKQNVQSQIPTEIGSETSKLAENVQKSPIINQKFKDISQNLTYNPVSNEQTMQEAKTKLDSNLDSEVVRLFNVDPERATATDVAELIQLQYQYQQNNDLQSFQETINKLREIGTKSGQAVQAFAIMQKMTPDGMVYYAQKDLQNLFDTLSENKSKQWIEKNKEKYNLTESKINTIKQKMEQVSQTTNEREQKILLAQVQKLVNDKIPSSIGNQIKSFRRISMLFNPKTQIRNIVGNLGVLPLNIIGDKIGSQIDKQIAKTTRVRTIGSYNAKNYLEGVKQGVSEVAQDYKLGIDTSAIQGNKFEIGKGNSFNDNSIIGKALNKVDRLNSMMLRMGDNPAFQGEFNNSLKNQMKLNNVAEPTADMIDIATQTALERTWQDNNNYTKSVLAIRNTLNKVNFKGFGLGDIIIPFAKTPANITKAMVDYSPVGLVKSLTVDVINFKNNLNNSTATPQMQRKLVNNISKGISGSLVYLIAFGLRDLISGGADEDKDIRDFMKNTMGVNPYSIKIGNKTYTYDWMQPVATPFSIIADSKNANKDLKGFQKVLASLGTAGDRLIEQSFVQGISDLFSNIGSGKTENIIGGLVEGLPSSFVPTLVKQVNDITDKYNRQVYTSKDVLGNAYRSTIAKIPGLSKTLPKKLDTFGKPTLKYGGDNNLFNIFLNPSNVNKEKNTKVSNEIIKLYNSSGEKTIFPRVSPSSIKKDDKTYKLTTKELSDYQKKIGGYSLNELNNLFNNSSYKRADEEEKIKAIEKIYRAAQAVAKEQYLKRKEK